MQREPQTVVEPPAGPPPDTNPLGMGTVEDDDVDLYAERYRPSRLTVVLAGAIVGVLVFTGGVLVQKHFGSATTTAGAPGGGTFRGGGEGFPAGGFGGGAGGYGGGAGGAGQAQGAGAGAAGGTSAAPTPVVVGTVTKISGSSVTVKNLGGKSVSVKVPSGTAITLKVGSSLSGLSGAGLRKGATVSVAGKAASSGTVTASSITVTG